MVANDPKAAKRLGIPQSVGRDYVEADKGRKFGSGGSMKESKAMMKKEVSFMKKKGAPASMVKHEESEMKAKKMASGGITTAKMGKVRTAAPSRDGLAAKGKTKGTQVKMAGSKPLGMKRGGKC